MLPLLLGKKRIQWYLFWLCIYWQIWIFGAKKWKKNRIPCMYECILHKYMKVIASLWLHRQPENHYLQWWNGLPWGRKDGQLHRWQVMRLTREHGGRLSSPVLTPGYIARPEPFKELTDYKVERWKHMNKSGFSVSPLNMFKSPRYPLLLNIVWNWHFGVLN